MTKEEKEAVLHCLRAMIGEELCEECPLYGTTGTDHCEKDCVRLAIEELEQKPCDKCVYSTSEGCQYDDITETIPPVAPQPKTGHWIPSHVPGSILDECSECGFSCGAFTFKFCPMCGAKMQEAESEK